jgi:ParB family chromosome partitioning protein
MNNISNKSPFALEPIEDRIDILFKELELAFKWERPSILLAIYSSEYVQTDAATSLENQLIDRGIKVVRVDIKESESVDVGALIAATGNPDNTVFFVDGFRWAVQKDGTNIYRVLNTSRENFINRQIRVVLWLTENEAIDLARYAPDYWAYRHRVVEFIESPEPEQILLRSLTSAWQVLGEDTDTIENTDEKIALRRAMLADLPDRTEALSIRSNLLLSLGILYWRKGAMDTAVEHLNEALGIATKIDDPRLQAACFNAIAIVQTDLGLVDDAIGSYQKTIALAPDQTFTWNNLGNLYEKLGRCEEAIQAFMKALGQTPSDALSWNGLGNVYLKQHRNAEAIVAYNKSIELAPDLAYPWNGLGNAYASQGDFEAAIPAYQKSVELNKDFSVPWVNLGDIYQEQGSNQEALKAYWNAVRIDSKNAQIWNSLGNAYMSAGLCEEAIKSYNKAIKLNRNYEAAYTSLAAAYSLVGNYEEAVAFYQKSVELLKQPAEKNQIEQTYRQFVPADREEPEIEEAADDIEAIEDPVEAKIKAMLLEIDPEFETEADVDNRETPLKSAGQAGETDNDEGLDELSDADDAQDAGETEVDNGETSLKSAGQAGETDEVGQPVVELPSFVIDEPEPVAQNETLTAAEEPSAVEAVAGVEENSVQELETSVETESAQGDAPVSNPDENIVAEPEVVTETEPEAPSHESPTIEIVFQDIEQFIEVEVHGCEADHFEHESAVPQPVAESQQEVLDEKETVPAAPKPRFERMPKDAFVWNELGNLYFNISEYEDAVAAYKQAIQLDPTLGWGYSNLALTYSIQGRFDEAIQIYGKIIFLLTTPDEKVSWRGPGSLHVIHSWMNSLHQIADSTASPAESVETEMREMPVEDIYANPEQQRSGLELGDLVNSVREQGVLEPLVVTPNGKPGKFMLISGMRRLEAARKAGLQSVPVIIRETNCREKVELALLENARRFDLNPLELAEIYFQLTDEFHLSYEELASRVSKNRSDIANTINLLKLSEKVKVALSDRAITEDHAFALLALSTPLAQDILLKNILDRRLSVQQTEELVRNSVGRKPSFLFAEKEYDEPDLSEYEESVHPAGNFRRKDAKHDSFSLMSRARSVLRSNYQATHVIDSLTHQHLTQEGEVHE